jgi:hypothetical protein
MESANMADNADFRQIRRHFPLENKRGDAGVAATGMRFLSSSRFRAFAFAWAGVLARGVAHQSNQLFSPVIFRFFANRYNAQFLQPLWRPNG